MPKELLQLHLHHASRNELGTDDCFEVIPIDRFPDSLPLQKAGPPGSGWTMQLQTRELSLLNTRDMRYNPKLLLQRLQPLIRLHRMLSPTENWRVSFQKL